MKYISSPFSIAPLQMYCKNNFHSSSSVAIQIILFNLIIYLKNIQNYRGNNRHLLFSLDSCTAWSNLSHLFQKIIIYFLKLGNFTTELHSGADDDNLKLSCDSRFQCAFTLWCCTFKVITLGWANQVNYFINANACSKRTLKKTVATQLKWQYFVDCKALGGDPLT